MIGIDWNYMKYQKKELIVKSTIEIKHEEKTFNIQVISEHQRV